MLEIGLFVFFDNFYEIFEEFAILEICEYFILELSLAKYLVGYKCLSQNLLIVCVFGLHLEGQFHELIVEGLDECELAGE